VLVPALLISFVTGFVLFSLSYPYIVRFTENYFSIALGLVQAARSTSVFDHTMNSTGSLGNTFFMTNAALLPAFRVGAFFPEGVRMTMFYSWIFLEAVAGTAFFFRAVGITTKKSFGYGLLTSVTILPVGGWAVVAYWPLIYWPPLVTLFGFGLVLAGLVFRTGRSGILCSVIEGLVQGIILLWLLLAMPFMAGPIAVFCIVVYLWRLLCLEKSCEIMPVILAGGIAASVSFVPCAGGLKAMADSSVRLIGAAHMGYPNNLASIDAWEQMVKQFFIAPHVTRVNELHGPPIVSFINSFLYRGMPFLLLGGAIAQFFLRKSLTRIYLLCAVMWITIRAFDVFHSAANLYSINTAYLETFLLPIHAVLVLMTIATVSAWGLEQFQGLLFKHSTGIYASRFKQQFLSPDSYKFPLFICIALILLSIAQNHRVRSSWTGYKEVRNNSAIVSILRKETALKLSGDKFRGRVINMGQESTPWRKDHEQVGIYTFDSASALATDGADFRWSLFYEGIPIYSDVGNFLSPFTVTAFHRLTGSKDNVFRMLQFLPINIPNTKLFSAIGVKYVITSAPLDISDSTLIIEEIVSENIKLYLYELKGVNLFNYSPTEVRISNKMDDILNGISNTDFEFSNSVYLSDNIESQLSKAKNSRAYFLKDRVAIAAESAGQSIILLPMEFSHCLELTVHTSHNVPPKLIRANGFMAAIIFEGESFQGEIGFKFSPLNAKGKTADFTDAINYGVADMINEIENSSNHYRTYNPISQ